MLPSYALSGQIWPARFLLDLDKQRHHSVSQRLLTDLSRPDQIGLRIEKIALHPGKPSHTEYVVWLDPVHDDMPMNRIYRHYNASRTISFEVKTSYTSYAQLIHGRWHPTHWRKIVTQYSNGQPSDTREEQYYLQIVTEIKLDPVWFTNPAERFKTIR